MANPNPIFARDPALASRAAKKNCALGTAYKWDTEAARAAGAKGGSVRVKKGLACVSSERLAEIQKLARDARRERNEPL